jgi:hypothetical protein
VSELVASVTRPATRSSGVFAPARRLRLCLALAQPQLGGFLDGRVGLLAAGQVLGLVDDDAAVGAL